MIEEVELLIMANKFVVAEHLVRSAAISLDDLSDNAFNRFKAWIEDGIIIS